MLLPCTHAVVPLPRQTSIRSPICREDLDVLTLLYHHVLVGNGSRPIRGQAKKKLRIETSFICVSLFHSSCRDSFTKDVGPEERAWLSLSVLKTGLTDPVSAEARAGDESELGSCPWTSRFAQSARGWPVLVVYYDLHHTISTPRYQRNSYCSCRLDAAFDQAVAEAKKGFMTRDSWRGSKVKSKKRAAEDSETCRSKRDPHPMM